MTTSSHSPGGAPGDEADPSAPPSHRRLLVGAFFLCVIAVVIVAAVIVGIGVRSDAEAGRIAVTQGRRALAAGDLELALDRFEAAEARFASGRARASGGLGGLLGRVPVLGRSFDVAAGVSGAGADLAGAGADLTRSIAALPDGLGSLAPSEGVLPIEEIESLADDVALAAADARAALKRVQATPTSLIPAPVADARFLAEEQAAVASQTLDAASLLVEGLPAFAGADGLPRDRREPGRATRHRRSRWGVRDPRRR
jgi:hypothetical protein